MGHFYCFLDIYRDLSSLIIMIIWVITSFLFLVVSAFFAVKILVFNKIEKKRREFYTFKNEEGEEIPIGI